MSGVKPDNAVDGVALQEMMAGLTSLQPATGDPSGGIINQFKADNNIADVQPAPAAPQVKQVFDMNM